MPHDIVMIDGRPVLVDEEVLMEGATAAPEAPTEPPALSSEPPEPTSPAPSQRQTSTKPQEASWEEWQRRQDSVKTLAREFDELDHGDIREYLAGRVNRELTDDEVGQIRHDVMAQRTADIADIFDEQLRSTSEKLKRARRTVRVQAPRGWLRRAFNSLDERAVGQVAARLIQRGHDSDHVIEKVISRVKDEESRENLEKLIKDGELKVEFAQGGLVSGLHDSVPALLDNGYVINRPQQEVMDFALSMAEAIATNVRTPDVQIEVPVTIAGQKKRVVRDENGLITEVVEED